MSYDISLVDITTKEVLQLERPIYLCSATYPIGGSTECWMSMTFNYGTILRRIFPPDGIHQFHDMVAEASIPLLVDGITQLKWDVSNDYWEATEGNVKAALLSMITLALIRPDGVWEISS
jgi:hypothetical protein